MRERFLRWFTFLLTMGELLSLPGCGGGDAPPPTASRSDISVQATQPGATPFIAFARLAGSEVLSQVVAVAYTIQPKSGTVSRPVHVTFSTAALARRGYSRPSAGILTVPVFGLYAGTTNNVSIDVLFADGSAQNLPLAITTAAYVDPNAVYDRPTVLRARASGTVLGFDFFAMKSGLGTPVIVDTDGQMRWVGPGIVNSFSSHFLGNAFVIGEQRSLQIRRLELDGTSSLSTAIAPSYTGFHHNIDPGKSGLLMEMDAGANSIESILVDMTPAGVVLKEWDLAAILVAYMNSHGDDSSAFVRPGVDWFHMNAASYDPRDDSVIVSSRENFLIKLKYGTGEIVWIFGDPTKYWYTFPSLRAKALHLESGGLYPVGQHATSLTSDGLLMLFNDGAPSFWQPAGAPVGESRSYSAVSAYSIDESAMIVREAWRFDYNQSILSDVCSSVYETAGKSLLISYAVASGRTRARLVGLDSNRQVVFDFEYPTTGCNTSWNAEAIPLEDLRFDR